MWDCGSAIQIKTFLGWDANLQDCHCSMPLNVEMDHIRLIWISGDGGLNRGMLRQMMVLTEWITSQKNPLATKNLLGSRTFSSWKWVADEIAGFSRVYLMDSEWGNLNFSYVQISTWEFQSFSQARMQTGIPECLCHTTEELTSKHTSIQ